MKRPGYFMIIILFLAVFLASCYKDITYTAQPGKPAPVINCLFTNDSVWSVRVSLTGGSELGLQPLDNAIVRIRSDNGFSEQLLYNDSADNYISAAGSSPEKGVKYHLLVSIPGYDSITASGSIPQPAIFHPIHFDTNATTIIPYPLSDPVKALRSGFSVTDTESTEKYYLLRPQYYFLKDLRPGNPDIYDTRLFYHQRGFITDLYFKQLADDYRSIFGIKPDNINFSNYPFDILYSYYPGDGYAIENGVIVVKKVRWFLATSTLSRDAYEYLTTYLQNIANRNNPFAEQINVHTNIRNGLGIFAGMYTERIQLNP